MKEARHKPVHILYHFDEKLGNAKLIYGDRKLSNCYLRQGSKVVLIGKECDRAFWGDKNVLYIELGMIIHLITFVKILQGIHLRLVPYISP